MTKQEAIAVTNQAQGIAAALIKAQAAMGPVRKDAKNDAFKKGGQATPYATLQSVLEACMDPLNENGIAVIQPIGQDDMGMYVSTVFVHTSGERLECRVPLLVTKQDMQGFGSAVTYARRYGLMAMAGIAPEDDDGNAAVKAAPRAAPAQAMSEGLADAWEDGVLDSLPDHASPRVKAEAFAAAICAGFQGKGHKALDNEWTRRQKWIDGLKGKYPDLYAQVETAYNSRRDQWEAENA